ncbi:tRNA1(Val) (adenine(37)-N6)-methyltransferase [Palleronia sp. KMU-117]|uniref:tRNA1(Val) (adenine(37)-N6)-methyltransferase n=1 Tax=Palleronia sp. KMU-117 TaxID=3434108 RepID=UPI003D70DC27
MTDDTGPTRDAFLGGRLGIFQPRRGYRAGADAVFLAAAVPATSGERVLELGCGVGVAALCLAARVPGVILTGVERDPEAAELARRNTEENALPLRVIEADVARLPAALRGEVFDHVMMNPPFFTAGTRPDLATRAGARHEETPLDVWLECAVRRLRPGGLLTVIQSANRVPDLVRGLDGRMGSLRLRPLSGRADRPAGRVLLAARKGGRAPFVLLPPFVLHEGAAHAGDGESYSAPARAILRDAAALE